MLIADDNKLNSGTLSRRMTQEGQTFKTARNASLPPDMLASGSLGPKAALTTLCAGARAADGITTPELHAGDCYNCGVGFRVWLTPYRSP